MELGLLYYGARFYVPGLGRFASADTIIPNPANPQSYNRYSYVRNSPLNFTDPTGPRECDLETGDCSGGPGSYTPPPLPTRLWVNPDDVKAVQLYGNTEFAHDEGEERGYDYSQGFHGGIDLMADAGTTVYGGMYGTVERISENAYGPAYVVIRISPTTAIVLGHLAVAPNLKVGDPVRPSTIIGATEETEDHVHVEFLTDYPPPGGMMKDATIVNPLDHMDARITEQLFTIIETKMSDDDYRINFQLRTDGQWQSPYDQPSLDYWGSSLQE